MPLLKSLLCFKGFDKGARYLLITGICYLLLIILSSVLAKAIIVLVLLLVVTLPILLATSIRRLNDAHFSNLLAIATPLMYLSCALLVTFIHHKGIWLLFLPAALITLATGLINNAKVRKNYHYLLGYSGPVDLNNTSVPSQTQYSFNDRIEPTLATPAINESLTIKKTHHQINDTTEASQLNEYDVQLTSRGHNYPAHTRGNNVSNWQQNLTNWFADNRQIKIASLLGVLAIIILSIIIQQISSSNPQDEINPKPVVESAAKQRLNKVEMPDHFWVMHDEHEAVTIGWQGEIKSEGEIWSAKTALGDESCAELSFGRDDKFRSLKVLVKNQGDYYADFSPIDTKAIITAIGLKSKFKLCGYEFSLKGTQAKLMNNKKYASYFDE